eukprot:TRINITY_DN7276_c1_g2_i1.p1 TRINITY_DN7276_c1_g2~~TRINITY_DN7276_c1_g2_i1.p1  ORF type:complete len:500 (-),score=49.49 TRINITY_DN7276_c1_g2_i1:296-1627(-)
MKDLFQSLGTQLCKSQLAEMFQAADKDESGFLSVDEFVDFIYSQAPFVVQVSTTAPADVAPDPPVASRTVSVQQPTASDDAKHDDILRELASIPDLAQVEPRKRVEYAARLLRGTRLDKMRHQMGVKQRARESAFALVGRQLEEAKLYSTKALVFEERTFSPSNRTTTSGPRRYFHARVDVFVSHAWPASPKLRGWELEAQLVNIFGPSEFQRVRLWLDKFSSPQEGAAFVQARRFGFFFQEYLALCPRAVVLFSPEYYQRLWCRYELVCFAALHSFVDLHLSIGKFLSDGIRTCEDGQATWEEYESIIRNTSTKTAACHFESDRMMLSGLINENFTSEEDLDTFLRFAVVALLARNMLLNVNITNTYYPKVISLARSLGYSRLGAELGRIGRALQDVVSRKALRTKVYQEFDKHVHGLLVQEQNRILVQGSSLFQLKMFACA